MPRLLPITTPVRLIPLLLIALNLLLSDLVILLLFRKIDFEDRNDPTAARTQFPGSSQIFKGLRQELKPEGSVLSVIERRPLKGY
ncbi:hypothetical protein SUGI_0948700 [Cryptomeria japonica]|nr:hypothetical protein SUGI_0948700 [Cryptomeria japonica]